MDSCRAAARRARGSIHLGHSSSAGVQFLSPAIERWLAVPRWSLTVCPIYACGSDRAIPTCPSPNARQEKQEHLARKSYVAVLSGAVFKQAPSPIHAHTARTHTHAHANVRKNTRGHVHAHALVSVYARESADAAKTLRAISRRRCRPLAPRSNDTLPIDAGRSSTGGGRLH